MDHSRLLKNLVLIAQLAFALTIIGSSMPSAVAAGAAGNGELQVAVWNNGSWQAAGALSFDQNIRQQQIDLSSFAFNNPAQVRLTHTGTTAAHIDTITLGGQTPVDTLGASESSALAAKKLAHADYDVIDATGKTLTFLFAWNGQAPVLAIAARIEPEKIFGVPFEFPTSNVYGAVDRTSHFYAYRLNSVPGALTLNGDLNDENLGGPFFKEWSQPVTGHPANFTYGWVMNDANNLYIAIDFASDNTYDGEKDYTAVYVKTAQGVDKFRVSVPEQQWGVPGFGYTDKAVYEHKVYEYKIPLAQIGAGVGGDSAVELAFEAYGTSAATSLISSLNPSTVGQSVMFTATATGSTNVAFKDGGTVIPGCGAVAAVQVSAVVWVATCTTSSLAVGNHTITAEGDYSGPVPMTANPPQKGNPQVVRPLTAAMTLTGPSGTFPNAQAFTFIATVSGGTAQLSGAKKAALMPMLAPTGTVSFYDNSVLIPSCAKVPLNASGVARCTVTLGLGTHRITATYNGDTIFSAVTAAQTLTIVVAVPAEVPEGDTLLLLGGGLGGLGVWLRYQWSRRRKVG